MTESNLRSRADYQIFEGKKVIFEELVEYVPPTPRITPVFDALHGLAFSADLRAQVKRIGKMSGKWVRHKKLINFLNAHFTFAFQKFGFWCSQSQFPPEPVIVNTLFPPNTQTISAFPSA